MFRDKDECFLVIPKPSDGSLPKPEQSFGNVVEWRPLDAAKERDVFALRLGYNKDQLGVYKCRIEVEELVDF